MADVLTGCLLLHALFESLYQRFDDQVDADLIDGFDVVRVAIAQCHFHSLQERVPDFLKKKKKINSVNINHISSQTFPETIGYTMRALP